MKTKIISMGVLLLVFSTFVLAACIEEKDVIVCYIENVPSEVTSKIIGPFFRAGLITIEEANKLTNEFSLMDPEFLSNFQNYVETSKEKGLVIAQIKEYLKILENNKTIRITLDDNEIKDIVEGRISFEDLLKSKIGG